MSRGEVKTVNGRRIATPEYRSWQMMKNRVLNSKATDYKYYGARGVKLDPRWHDFDEFLRDMGRRPTALHTLERRAGCKHYNKKNCCWATRLEQARNRRGYVKLSVAKAQKIRELYAIGRFRQIDLATFYGVTQTSISQIVRGVAWKGAGA